MNGENTMVSIIVGGQIGSEGKGKIAAYLSKEYDMSVRTGGPNAGHTINNRDSTTVMRLLPCAYMNPKCLLAIAAGSLIDVNILVDEIERLNIEKSRLIIDPQAGIIEKRHIEREAQLYKNWMSTGKGVGQATVDKIIRDPEFKLAKDIDLLKPYIRSVEFCVNEMLSKGKSVLIEGTQGFDLSVHHGSYPYVTSRDTTACTFAGEVGVGPSTIKDVFMILRTYPIRAAKGPIHNETSWEQVTINAKASKKIEELTSVTKTVRRVGEFDYSLVEKAVRINKPTQIVLNFVDYLSVDDYGVRNYQDLSNETKKFIDDIEKRYGVPVTLIGTGPDLYDIVDMRSEKI